jgi:transcriptional regulator with XRE-family HTH domain
VAIKIKVKDNKQLAELIYRNGFSVRSLARKANLSDTTIQLLIDGTRSGCGSATAKRIVEILEPFGVKFDDVFFIENTYKSKFEGKEEAATKEAVWEGSHG